MEIFKSIDGTLVKLEELEKGAWVNLVSPSEDELLNISKKLGISIENLQAALDIEERPRIEYELNEQLILIDAPHFERNENSQLGMSYTTIPLGIIITDSYFITVCSESISLLIYFNMGFPKNFDTSDFKTFLFQLLLKNSANYLIFLKNIEKLSKEWEKELAKSIRNRELLALLELEKSLVYFSTSLKSNELVLEKISRLAPYKKSEEDKELMEDVIIENRQALEMSKIYSDVLSVTMDVFGNVISNNFNTLMKRLTSVTIVMAIPTILSGIWGMNTWVPFASGESGFFIVILITALISLLITLLLRRKELI